MSSPKKNIEESCYCDVHIRQEQEKKSQIPCLCPCHEKDKNVKGTKTQNNPGS